MLENCGAAEDVDPLGFEEVVVDCLAGVVSEARKSGQAQSKRDMGRASGDENQPSIG